MKFIYSCRLLGIFPKHQWGQWNDTQRGTITREYQGKERIIGEVYSQERRCQQCNQLKVRQIQFMLI